jgi:cytochrome c oxidase cbb3-type subunit III
MDEPRETPEYPLDGEPERDGIDEHDHPIPLWFNAVFALSVAFGIFYIAYWVGWSDWSQADAWRQEVAAADARAQALRAAMPQTNPYRGQAQAIAEGMQIYNTTCAACHKPDASGLIGPSLVDAYWKYGSDDPQLFDTVSAGRPGGMPPWGPALGSEKIWKALAYVETLPRSDQPGIGAPDYAPPPAR